MFFKRKKVNFYDVIPVYRKNIVWYNDKNNLVTILIKNKNIFSAIFKKPQVTHVHLDKLGSFVWNNINSTNTIMTHARLLKERFGTNAEPLYPRIIKYFRLLNQNEFINFIVKPLEKKQKI